MGPGVANRCPVVHRGEIAELGGCYRDVQLGGPIRLEISKGETWLWSK